MKKYRIIKKKDGYYLEVQWKLLGLIPMWDNVTINKGDGRRARIWAEDPEQLKLWVKEVKAGRIDPEKPDQRVVEEFEA